MKHRIFALFLVLVLLVGVLAGCSKKNNGDSDTSNGNSSIITPTKDDQSQVTSKYAYKPTYLTVPAEVDSVTGVAAKGSTVWFTASIPDGEQTETLHLHRRKRRGNRVRQLPLGAVQNGRRNRRLHGADRIPAARGP